MNTVETSQSRDPEPKTVIAIAVGSGIDGGREAIRTILRPLPSDFPAVILVTMHVGIGWKENLAEILDAQIPLNVRLARSGDRITASTVFIAPPNYHLLVTTLGVLWLSVEAKVHLERPAADPLFRSVAEVYGNRAIGVVLTGDDGDGAAGVQAIKREGGRTIAQSEASSENPDMPHSAVATGRVDRVLPLAEIAGALREMVGEPSFA